MRLFFETYSIIQILFLLQYIKRAKIICFHKRLFPRLNYNPWIKMIAERLIHLINRQIRIETFPAEKINEHSWLMNKISPRVVEELSFNLENSAIYRTILKIIGDENILKCYKMQMVSDVSARLLFFKIAKEIIKEDKDERIWIVPADNDNSKIQQASLGQDSLEQFILSASRIANRAKDFFCKIHFLLIFLLLPVGYILKHCKKISLRKINKKSYDIAMPVLSGFYEGSTVKSGFKPAQDDGYLYNKDIVPGCIIHLFSYWRRPSQIEESWKDIMRRRNIPYLDIRDYKINGNLIMIAAKMQLKVISHCLLRLFFWGDSYKYIVYSNKIVHWMLLKYREFENVDYKVEFIRQDYNPLHVVETILCNRRSKKTVGIQHSTSPYILPQLCYVHFDKYIVYGDVFIKLFSPYWERAELAKTGRENIDWVVNILKDRAKIAALRKQLLTKYTHRRYTAVVLFPGSSEHNLKSRWEEIYSALDNLKTLDIDFNLFLRFRPQDVYCRTKYLKRFENLSKEDERIIIDHNDFTTYELISLSDLLIANNASFGVYEALAAGVKTFTFDFMGVAKYFFPGCGKDFILYSKEDLLRVFKGLNHNFDGFDCNWEKLKRDSNFYYDGKNLARIQKTVWETVKEAI